MPLGRPLSLVAERPRLQRRCAVGDDGAVASRLFAFARSVRDVPEEPAGRHAAARLDL
jgi:hypothetical protein